MRSRSPLQLTPVSTRFVSNEHQSKPTPTVTADLSADITLEGTTRTYVEKIATTSPTSSRTEAFQSFLRLVQPMDDSDIPEPRVLEEGRAYKFPFTFNIPERLLPQSCTHAKENEAVEEAHLNLPPSLGDPMVATEGGKALLDDMGPDMGTISYAIKVRITKGRNSNGKHMIVTEESRKLRVIPAVPEWAPLDVLGGQYDDYNLRKEKDIKKGMFKGRLGRLSMESSQPKSLRLPSVRCGASRPTTTMATVNLRFDPTSETSGPPRLNQLNTKIKVSTFFSSVPMREIPTKASEFFYSSTKGLNSETLNLSSRCLASVEWERHETDSDPIRRGSAFSTLSGPGTAIPRPSESYLGKSFYTATVLVPITLSKGSKTFVPTFHSCLVSRMYALDLYLSVNTPGIQPSLHLKLPIQVSAEGSDARPTISDEEAAAIAAREANAFFVPRSVAPPIPEYTEREPGGQSMQTPGPEYSPIAGHTSRQSIARAVDRGYDSDNPPGYSSIYRRAQSMAI